MKKFISVILTLAMLISMIGVVGVSAAANDGAMDFDLESAPTFTVTGEGTANEMHTYTEDDYTIQGRVSHPAHSWEIEKDAFGKNGYSILGKGVKDVEVSETQSDPCMIGFVNLTNPKYAASTDQYYTFEFDVAFEGNNTFELLATTDNGSTVVLFSGNGENRTLSSDALRASNLYVAYKNTWHKIKVVIKSADVTATDDGAADSVAEDGHQYWIYANGNLIKSGTTSIKKRNETNSVNSFAGFKAFQFRAYGVINNNTEKKTTGDWSIRLDNISTSVSDALPVTNWESGLSFDSLTESTDMAAINNELWAKETGYLTSGNNYTWVRNTTKGCASVEGGVFGKDASDKAIAVWLDGTQTDGTHFFQIHQAGQGMNQMQRMGKGDFYEFQTYMAWEEDAKLPGVQGFYSNTASNDGKGKMLLNVSPATGLVYVFGTVIPNIKVSSDTWYKFNVVVHSGDVAAENDADKNWFNFYINDKLVAEKVVFTPSIRNGTQATFLGVDQYWFQVGAVAPNTSGKVYYDDIKIKYSTSEATYSPALVSTTDEVAAAYLGAEGHVPGFNSYVDERVSFDAEKWSVTDGTITLVPATADETYAKIVKNDGTKIYDTFKVGNSVAESKTFDANSTATGVFSFGYKDFSTYTFGTGIAGRSADDYSFKMDSVGVYDNWVMTVDEEGNATTAEYQANPENWINKSDIPQDTKATYKFRDSYNPFVQMYPANHFAALNYNAPWSANLSILADGDYNSADFQVISNDNGGRVTKNLFSLNNNNGHIYVEKTDTGISYREGEWLNFVVNVYPATKKLTLWYNGVAIYDGIFDFPWERFARIKIQHAIGHDGYHSANARTCKLYADDIIFYQGSRFVPAMVNPSASSEKFDSTFIENGVIIANADTTAADITGGITGGEVALYADKTYAAATDVTKGNIAVVKSADGLIYKYIYVADKDEDATAEMAYTQTYQIGDNSYAPKYFTDNVIDGTIIVATYKTVNGNIVMESCKYEGLENATYEYNGANLIMTPVDRVNITASQDVNEVKIFLWNDISGLKPIAAEHNCTLKTEQAE